MNTPQRPGRRRGSIHDVARAAGVGVVTVSRVVNGKPGVSEEMRAYVQGFIDSLGYVPKDPEHRPGRKPKVDETPTAVRRVIDLIIAFPLKLGEVPFRAPIYSRMLDEIDALAGSSGIDIYVRQKSTPMPAVYAEAVVGRIYFGRGDGPWQPSPGDNRDLPMVWLMNGDPGDFPGDAVRVDHERIGEIAARHLYAQGHRHVAYIGTIDGYSDQAYSLRGPAFAYWFHACGGTAVICNDGRLLNHPRAYNHLDEEVFAQVIDRCLAAQPRPTVLFLEFALMAPLAATILKARGLTMGSDIALMVCNNDDLYLSGLVPRPQVVDIPCRSMAALALDLIINHAQRPKLGFPVRHLVAPELII